VERVTDPRSRERIAQVMTAIVTYLEAQPAAADTAEGICEMWLDELGERVSEAEVRSALERLVGHGAVVARPLPGGSTLYVYVGVRRGKC
jgi:hypothetical protein